MKRVYIAMTVVATAAIAGCQQEKSFEEDINLGENAITFTIPAGVSTKASDAVSYVRSGVSIPVNADDDGGALFLEETVEDLEVMSPATKGTPAYTGNVGKFYKTIGVYAEGLDNAQYELASEDLVNGGWLYHHNYSGDPWSTAGNEIDFYLRMPYDMAGVSNLAYGKTDEGSLKISFDYTSPSSETASAAAQEDLLFATTTLSKDQYNNYFKSASKGAPVLFRHALSGVKFATANHISGSESGTKTYITKVKFTGLKNSGSCTFIPKGEETTVDDKTEYTSAASMVWTPGETTGEFVQVFTTENYGENVYDGSDLLTEDSTPGFFAEDKVSGIEGKKTSDWNINNQNGELTFWFIPQVLTDDVKLEITYYIDAGGRIGNEVTKTIDFGTLTKNADWKAGQLRTYVLKANEVDVEITDELSSNVKSNVKITNLGNVPQFVRATIVAYWAAPETQNPYDASSPLVAVFGYESETSDNFVTPWSLQGELGYVSGYTPYGTIDTFYPETDQTNWSTSSHDGYYYYKNVIGVDEAYTNVMFKSYTLDESKIPEIWQIDQKTLQRTQLQGVRLVMEIVCQAVIAKENGTDYVSWNEAWEEALGYNPAE